MKCLDYNNFNRRSLLGAFAGITTVAAAPSYSGVFSYNKGAGNIRSLQMRNTRTGETLETIYWIDGRYIKPVLKEINWFMRDWRENSAFNMNRELIDVIAATYARLDSASPILMLSGYRSEKTNRLLRRRSRKVAKDSYHTKGMACDIRVPGRSVKQMGRAARASRVGGLGSYYRSNFIHVDSGPSRSWQA